MDFEHKYTIPKVKEKTEDALDDVWYERFEKIGAFQEFEYLDGKKEKRESQKQDFLSEKLRNPTLDYPKLEKFDFVSTEQKLLELKKEILSDEKDETIRQIYRWKLNEKLAQLRLMLAAKDGDDRKYSRYSRFIYGEPSKVIFENSLADVEEKLRQNEDTDDIMRQFAIRRLREQLSFPEKYSINGGPDILSGSKQTITSREKKMTYDAEAIRQIFEWALQNRNIDGWAVVIEKESSKSAISVNHEKRQIIVPEKRKLNPSNLSALIEHEISTHVLRRENGERSKLRLLGLGLDRYLPGEEGISTYAEQQVVTNDDYAGFDGHLAIGLASGLDGKKRDFRDVFNVLRDYFFVSSKTKDIQLAWERAKINAWNRCVRTFRGTSCDTPGACLTRDIVYREGNIGIWNVIKNDPDEARRFAIGKYDPANPRHIWILEQLGITDQDLEDLDN